MKTLMEKLLLFHTSLLVQDFFGKTYFASATVFAGPGFLWLSVFPRWKRTLKGQLFTILMRWNKIAVTIFNLLNQNNTLNMNLSKNVKKQYVQKHLNPQKLAFLLDKYYILDTNIFFYSSSIKNTSVFIISIYRFVS